MPVNDRGGMTRRARKHKPLPFGGTWVRLLVGPHNRKFSAHEDLLCARSAFFKNRFQAIRKDISGDCAVCLQDLEMTDTEYCTTCGQNFHVSCIRDWVQTTNSTCPSCRIVWRKLVARKSSTLDQLDPDGFEVYVQWLYRDRIPHYTGDADDRVLRLLKAHIVGETLDDIEFLFVVRKEIVEVALEARDQTRISYAVIDFAYQKTHTACLLRRFMCDLYAVTGSAESLEDHGNVSRLFLIDMAKSFINKSGSDGNPDVKGMMADEGYIELEIREQDI